MRFDLTGYRFLFFAWLGRARLRKTRSPWILNFLFKGVDAQADTNFIHRVVIFRCRAEGVDNTLLRSDRLRCHSVSFMFNFCWGGRTLKNHSPVNKDVSLEQGRRLQAPAHGKPILHVGVTKVFINLHQGVVQGSSARIE